MRNDHSFSGAEHRLLFFGNKGGPESGSGKESTGPSPERKDIPIYATIPEGSDLRKSNTPTEKNQDLGQKQSKLLEAKEQEASDMMKQAEAALDRNIQADIEASLHPEKIEERKIDLGASVDQKTEKNPTTLPDYAWPEYKAGATENEYTPEEKNLNEQAEQFSTMFHSMDINDDPRHLNFEDYSSEYPIKIGHKGEENIRSTQIYIDPVGMEDLQNLAQEYGIDWQKDAIKTNYLDAVVPESIPTLLSLTKNLRSAYLVQKAKDRRLCSSIYAKMQTLKDIPETGDLIEGNCINYGIGDKYGFVMSITPKGVKGLKDAAVKFQLEFPPNLEINSRLHLVKSNSLPAVLKFFEDIVSLHNQK